VRTLTNPAGSMRVNNASWVMVLRLATTYGWKPKGTIEPDDWSGVAADGVTPRLWNPRNYWSRHGQQVLSEDAEALASALETALPDVPDHDAMEHKIVTSIDFPDRNALRFVDPFKRFNPYEYFSGTNKARLTRFIEFCRSGGFRIA
jgi:hypothetical protein